MNDEEVLDFLEHYGVRGMHWGVITEEHRTAVERRRQDRRNTKAQKFEDKAKVFQKKYDETSKFRSGRRSELQFKRQQALEDAQRKREGKLTRRQKKALIVGAIITTKVAYNLLQSGQARESVQRGKEFVTKQPTSFKLDPKLATENMSEDEIMSKVVSKVNPSYGGIGTKQNCRRATFAYEMRRRGYDVAATRSSNGRGQDPGGLYNALNPGQKPIRPGLGGAPVRILREMNRPNKPFTDFAQNHALGDSVFSADSINPFLPNAHNGLSTSITQHLSTLPNGSRGELGIKWRPGGGHSIAWEVVNGKAVFFDCQSGKKYVGQEVAQLLDKASAAGVTRLDDKQLNTRFLIRWVKNA